jgi:hypothetical protein
LSQLSGAVVACSTSAAPERERDGEEPAFSARRRAIDGSAGLDPHDHIVFLAERIDLPDDIP